MKNLLNTVIVLAMMLSLGVVEGYSQDDHDDVHNLTIAIPEVALLDLESTGSKDITLGPDAPTEAGLALDFSNESNSDLWINYSSIVGKKSDPQRDISVQITAGQVPAGMILSVVAGKDVGAGDGTMGTPGNTLELGNKPQDIISGVGSAYTGNGPARGHQLTYSLALDSKKGVYGNIDFDEANTLAITYTLTDQ